MNDRQFLHLKLPARQLPRGVSIMVVIGLFAVAPVSRAAERAALAIPAEAQKVVESHCIACHGPDKQKGKVRLDTLAKLDGDARIDLLNTMHELIRLEEMPPKDEKQPTKAERKLLDDWIAGELRQAGPLKLDEKLRRPEAGNYVNHDDLFSGEYAKLPGFTFDRRWLISEFIFDGKINSLVDHQGVRTIDGQRMKVIGDNGVNLGTQFGGQSLRQSITNPFLLPTTIGVRYYSNDALTGGHLLTMIANAKKIAAYMSSEQTMKAHYPAMYRLMQLELAHRETLRARERFLADHIERLLKDVYQEKNAALLPVFVRMNVEDPPVQTNSDGSSRKESNLGLLDRFDDQDLRAIYLGMGQYKREGVPIDKVIEQCERDWFIYGIHEKRIQNRISIMKVLHTNWETPLIDEDVRKKNIRPVAYAPLNATEMAVITATIKQQRSQGDRYQQIIDKCMAHWSQEFEARRVAVGELGDNPLGDLVVELYAKVFERKPTAQEMQDNISLIKSCMVKLSRQEAIAKLIESLILSSEFVYRFEFG